MSEAAPTAPVAGAAEQPPRVRRKRQKPPPTAQLVDLEILATVHKAASLRLRLVRGREQVVDGVASTTLAVVARKALADWQAPVGMPDESASPEKRPMRGGAPVKHFRFYMPASSYPDLKNKIHFARQSVAGVVQAALEKFARTGEY